MLRDVPCGGSQIHLTLTVRKFFCRNQACPRKIFTERLPTFALPCARMTAKAIARRFQLSDRTVHRWLAAGSFH